MGFYEGRNEVVFRYFLRIAKNFLPNSFMFCLCEQVEECVRKELRERFISVHRPQPLKLSFAYLIMIINIVIGIYIMLIHS